MITDPTTHNGKDLNNTKVHLESFRQGLRHLPEERSSQPTPQKFTKKNKTTPPTAFTKSQNNKQHKIPKSHYGKEHTITTLEFYATSTVLRSTLTTFGTDTGTPDKSEHDETT